jgi:hypothetical protein
MKCWYPGLLSASAASGWLHRRSRWVTAALVAVATLGALTITPAFSGTASASTVSPTAQLVFDDYLGYVNSIQVYGENQNGVYENTCWTTPLTVNLLPNWWWAYGTEIWAYTSSNCSTGRVNSAPYTLTNSPTNPPYHCQEDVSPYSDWNPGSDWHNCAIPPKYAWYGYAIGSLVWRNP